ncbi:uncharacterized protein N7484_010915 [Penicillium longicatenatum]|uniref:uncharacterized protein n=1 Tax=Penicillium longicatenatum TaxID=1561947 RepID=UPI002548F681|nr:uncharacterized protein N7484_010915 [Penicillium longicatenatum]KAJ5630815.1 hypothetical protein N7484_010915 [Penicillium longicatenatum]
MIFPSKASWGVVMVTGLLAATVYAIPIRESNTDTQNKQRSTIQPRDPRLMPLTTDYIDGILDILGMDSLNKVLVPTSTTATTATTETPTSSAIHGVEVTTTATPTIAEEMPEPSSITTADEMTFTTTIKNGNNRPIENIQVGQGWKGSNRLQASDVPVIMGAVEEELANRFNDLVDSSDELGLD